MTSEVPQDILEKKRQRSFKLTMNNFSVVMKRTLLKFPVIEVAVDLWSNTIAIE